MLDFTTGGYDCGDEPSEDDSIRHSMSNTDSCDEDDNISSVEGTTKKSDDLNDRDDQNFDNDDNEDEQLDTQEDMNMISDFQP